MNVKQRRVNEISSLFILTAGVLWGIISLFVRHLQETGLTSMQIVSVRVLLAAVIMVLYLVLRDRQALRIKLKDKKKSPNHRKTEVLSDKSRRLCRFHRDVEEIT